jgi:ABC-type multidrug transport system fused ATPase/permease subunit
MIFLAVGGKGQIAAIVLTVLACCIVEVKSVVYNRDNTIWPKADYVFVSSGVFSFLEFFALMIMYNAMNVTAPEKKVKKKFGKGGDNDNELSQSLLDPSNDIETGKKPSDKKDKKDKEGKSPATFMRIMSLAGPEKWWLTVGIVCLVVSTISDVTIPTFIGNLIDVISPVTKGDAPLPTRNDVGWIALKLTGVFTIGSLFTFLRASIFQYSGERVVARLRRDLYSNILIQEVAFFDESQVGELINRISSDTTVLQDAVTSNVSMVLRFTAQVVLGLVVLFMSSTKLTLVMLGVVPAIIVGAVVFGRFVRRLSKSYQESLAAATSIAEETFGNVRTVRSFAQEKKEITRYSDAVNTTLRTGGQKSVAFGSFAGGIFFLSYVAIAIVLYFGGLLVLKYNEDVREGKSTTGDMSSGDLTKFLLQTVQIAGALAGLSSVWGAFMNAIGASDRVFRLIDRKGSIPLDGGKSFFSIEGNVEFKDVSFTYPTRPDAPVLDKLSLTVSKGQVVALVGPSGSGKSTVISLLERYYDCTGGKITIDGHDIRSMDHENLHSHIALVSQEPKLFNTSIAENISYGCLKATPADIEAAAKAASAHNFIVNFPDGYDTMVGANGIQLSGGQKQRVAIARALLLDPTLLLLDEATSALDAESEHLVQAAIDELMKNRTTIVIAHRLSTVRNADKIVVISKGKIAEQGTHEELVNAGGMYRDLVKRQLEYGDKGPPGGGGDPNLEEE